MNSAYSVSSPIRRWNTSDLFATVRHYRITKVGFGLTLAVGADSRQGLGNRVPVERRAEWLLGSSGTVDGGR